MRKPIYDMNYNEALKIATEAHKGQKRKGSGKNYITHPIAVAEKFEDRDYKVVAVLHDTLEDTELTLEELKRRGLSISLATALEILTRKPEQSYLGYIIGCNRYPITRAIKIEDLKHNLSDNPPSEHQKDKYIMALYILGEKW